MKSIANVTDLAAKNPDFAKRVKPLLESIANGVDKLPDSVLKAFPDSVQKSLGTISTKVDDVADAAKGFVVRRFDSLSDFNKAANADRASRANQVLKFGNYKWTTDATGRVTKAEGVVDLTKHGRKTTGVSTSKIGK